MSSEQITNLLTLREAFEHMFWPGMVPVVDHAIALALEAEYAALRSSVDAMCGVEPVYPPLVQMLAAAAPTRGLSWQEGDRQTRAEHGLPPRKGTPA